LLKALEHDIVQQQQLLSTLKRENPGVLPRHSVTLHLWDGLHPELVSTLTDPKHISELVAFYQILHAIGRGLELQTDLIARGDAAAVATLQSSTARNQQLIDQAIAIAPRLLAYLHRRPMLRNTAPPEIF
jgi:hypothetical protein